MRNATIHYVLLASLTLGACQARPGSTPKAQLVPTIHTARDFNSCLKPPTVSADLPGDSPMQNQRNFNCFAWQQFIALSWLADPTKNGAPNPSAGADTFGEPFDLSPLVWQTYKDYGEVFRPNAAPPAPWNAPKAVPDSCRLLPDRPVFAAVFIDSSDTEQAAPIHKPSWLATAAGQLVWYEKLMNKDEFQYIAKHGFYAAENQLAAVKKGMHIDFPRGSYGGAVGSIELKAAWLAIDAPDDYSTYKVTQGYVYDPVNDHCHISYLALVGLHILHKTETQPQWVWATFEHNDNAPNAADAGKSGTDKYLFYTPQCQSHEIAPSCHPDTTSTTCMDNTPPAYAPTSASCPPYGVQVTRTYPIPDSSVNPVRTLNTYVQNEIRAANPDSVWQYYQLVNVLWSSSPIDPNPPGTPPATIPLNISGMTPDPITQPVANTTMETYVQDRTCIKCHRRATIANSQIYASDFSFLLRLAQPTP